MHRSLFPKLSWLLAVALCRTPVATAQTVFELTPTEYLDAPGFSVLAFHNDYTEGHQSGIELIHHGERIASSGFIRLEPEFGLRMPLPVETQRRVDPDRRLIEVSVNHPDLDFRYSVRVWPDGGDVHLAVDLERPLPRDWIGRASFGLELFPGGLFGKSFSLGGTDGIFPRQANGPVVRADDDSIRPRPLASGSSLVIAPEAPLQHVRIRQVNGTFSLVDARDLGRHNWYLLRTELPPDVTRNAVEWVLTPRLDPGWRRAAVIAHSQVGYHPDQRKQAILELDGRTERFETAVLERLMPEGDPREVLTQMPTDWGRWLRYRYAVFDFSTITEQGLFRVRYGAQTTPAFRIADDVYQDQVWQPTLEKFLPIQMCHMRVKDRARVWHGACHLDDALQAPAPMQHVDGYQQYETTDTPFEPLTPVPFLNVGGWHDAGDNDLAAGSQAQTVYFLALAGEEFGAETDQVSVDDSRRLVQLLRPDGVPDLLQQLKHGVENLLSGYRAAGHSFAGIIATREGRAFLGDVASLTDQLPYDRALSGTQVVNGRSGVPDDRLVFTNKDTSLEYWVAAALSAASRVIRDTYPDLAREGLETAEQVWHHQQSTAPVSHPNTYIPRRREAQEVLATVELLITTGEQTYARRLVELLPVVRDDAEGLAWAASRVLPVVQDAAFAAGVRETAEHYHAALEEHLAGNPFGVPWRPRVWGIGWDIQRYAVEQYYLHRAFPDLFDRENLLRVVNYVLGAHPASSTSLVSGVGARSLTSAYGFNMHEWSYIPGGMASGTALVRPDYPELKEPYPFLWQQTEYVIGGAATYLFIVQAADRLLNEAE